MPANEHFQVSVDEVISEIVTIFARGCMRHRNGRRLPPGSLIALAEHYEAMATKLRELAIGKSSSM